MHFLSEVYGCLSELRDIGKAWENTVGGTQTVTSSRSKSNMKEQYQVSHRKDWSLQQRSWTTEAVAGGVANQVCNSCSKDDFESWCPAVSNLLQGTDARW